VVSLQQTTNETVRNRRNRLARADPWYESPADLAELGRPRGSL